MPLCLCAVPPREGSVSPPPYSRGRLPSCEDNENEPAPPPPARSAQPSTRPAQLVPVTYSQAVSHMTVLSSAPASAVPPPPRRVRAPASAGGREGRFVPIAIDYLNSDDDHDDHDENVDRRGIPHSSDAEGRCGNQALEVEGGAGGSRVFGRSGSWLGRRGRAAADGGDVEGSAVHEVELLGLGGAGAAASCEVELRPPLPPADASSPVRSPPSRRASHGSGPAPSAASQADARVVVAAACGDGADGGARDPAPCVAAPQASLEAIGAVRKDERRSRTPEPEADAHSTYSTAPPRTEETRADHSSSQGPSPSHPIVI